MLDDLADLSGLDIETQEKRMTDYNMIHQQTVNSFLQHFSGIETFYRNPTVCIQDGIMPCSLQQSITNCVVKIEGAPDGNWGITDVLEKLTEQQFVDIAEIMRVDFETSRCPIEIKSSILKACGLHLKDVIRSVAHLANVALPIKNPDREDLANYAGQPSRSKDTAVSVTKMEEAATIDRAEVRGCLERMNSRLDGLDVLLHKMRAVRVNQELMEAANKKQQATIQELIAAGKNNMLRIESMVKTMLAMASELGKFPK